MDRPCPTCASPARLTPDNPDRPFCSRRCREVDLGRWLNEDYRIPVAPSLEDDLDAMPQEVGGRRGLGNIEH